MNSHTVSCLVILVLVARGSIHASEPEATVAPRIQTGEDAKRFARANEVGLAQIVKLLSNVPEDDDGYRNYKRTVLVPALHSLSGRPRPEDYLAETLLTRVKLYSTGVSLEGSRELPNWPAANVLIKIGSPVYPMFFDHLGQELDDLEMALMAHIMYQIDGTKIALVRLDEQLKYTRARERSSNFNDHPPQQLWKNLDKLREMLSNPRFHQIYDLQKMRDRLVREHQPDVPFAKRTRPWERPWE